MPQNKIKTILENSPLIPVCALDAAADAVPLAGALLAGGIKNIEITLRSDAALDAIKAICKNVPDMVVGAGTVFTAEQVYDCLSAGVSYIVSPGYSEEVHRVCEDHALPYLPGAVTPTEIQAAQAIGLYHLKFFPAAACGGIKTLQAFAPVFKDVKFCATGGVGLGDIGDYLAQSNVMALGMSALTPADIIMRGDWTQITQIATDALTKI